MFEWLIAIRDILMVMKEVTLFMIQSTKDREVQEVRDRLVAAFQEATKKVKKGEVKSGKALSDMLGGRS